MTLQGLIRLKLCKSGCWRQLYTLACHDINDLGEKLMQLWTIVNVILAKLGMMTLQRDVVMKAKEGPRSIRVCDYF